MALPRNGLRISKGVKTMRRDYGIYAGSKDAKLRYEAGAGSNSRKGTSFEQQGQFIDTSSKTIYVTKWKKKFAVIAITVIVVFIMIGAISVMATR